MRCVPKSGETLLYMQQTCCSEPVHHCAHPNQSECVPLLIMTDAMLIEDWSLLCQEVGLVIAMSGDRPNMLGEVLPVLHPGEIIYIYHFDQCYMTNTRFYKH